MVAVAQARPASPQRLVLVRSTPTIASVAAGRSAGAVPAATYRRRQAGALVLVATVLLTLVLAVHALLASSGGGPLTASGRPGGSTTVHVVQPGDTFWSIAVALRPSGDPRPLVARLVAAHGGAALVVGERLVLPTAA